MVRTAHVLSVAALTGAVLVTGPAARADPAAEVGPASVDAGGTVTVSVTCDPLGAPAPETLDATSDAFADGTAHLRKVTGSGDELSGPAYRGTARVAAPAGDLDEPGDDAGDADDPGARPPTTRLRTPTRTTPGPSTAPARHRPAGSRAPGAPRCTSPGPARAPRPRAPTRAAAPDSPAPGSPRPPGPSLPPRTPCPPPATVRPTP